MKKFNLFAVLVLSATQLAAQDFSKIEIKSEKITKDIYMLQGQGGNIGVIVGDDGVLMVDDQYAPLSEKISTAVKKISEKPIKFVINTHWHFDHTGGNENFGKAGGIIVAHENVRKLLSKDQFIKAFDKKIPALSKVGLPVITFKEGINFHFDNEEIRVLHVKNAHTDGDCIIHFEKANVIHAGDTFFNGFYPFMDVQHGGSIDGIIAAGKEILKMSDEKTKIIPGHGPLANIGDLKNYISMLESVRTSMSELVKNGIKREQAIKADPFAAYHAKWGGGFLKPEQFTGVVFDSLSKK